MNALPEEMQNRITRQALNAGVRPSYYLMMVRGIADNIRKDGIWDSFTQETADRQNDILMAYLAHQMKVNEKIKTAYATNPKARELFIKRIYEMLKNKRR